MQQIVYEEYDDGIFGNNVFIQVTSKRLKRDPNPSTLASTGIFKLDYYHPIWIREENLAEGNYKGY